MLCEALCVEFDHWECHFSKVAISMGFLVGLNPIMLFHAFTGGPVENGCWMKKKKVNWWD